MRDGWYSDDRDLVKWGALAYLVGRERLRSVVQVAMYRASKRPTLETGSGEIAISEHVWTHFRDVRAIEALGRAAGFHVSIIDAPFASRNRAAYFETVAAELRSMPDGKAVLLDPDTGFEPTTPSANHVTLADIQTTWDTLAEGDWLLLYQHRWRRTNWQEDARAKFLAATGASGVELLRASSRPSDVILLAAPKTRVGDA